MGQRKAALANSPVGQSGGLKLFRCGRLAIKTRSKKAAAILYAQILLARSNRKICNRSEPALSAYDLSLPLERFEFGADDMPLRVAYVMEKVGCIPNYHITIFHDFTVEKFIEIRLCGRRYPVVNLGAVVF